MIETMFDPKYWAVLPFHFWSVVFFIFGSMIGSFLNVCIYRMPLGQSIVSPPSHCPHCNYSIPWFLNIPLLTWVYLGGKCRNCAAPISMRYFLVELLTAIAFCCCWIAFGHASAWLALIYCIFLAGLIVATFIDFEHFIIPDEITFGGIVVGFLCSFLFPPLHGQGSLLLGMKRSALGIAVGAGLIYGILRLGKLLFGRLRVRLPEGGRIVFTETALQLPDQQIPYEEVFYRSTDAIRFQASILELVDRCYKDVRVRLSPSQLQIGEETLSPETVPHMEAVSSEVVLPREAMGLGDVKFMAAIGAFLGWKAVIFSLMVSSMIGSFVGITSILLRKQAWSARLPYGPYIALAATIWVFWGHGFVEAWLMGMR